MHTIELFEQASELARRMGYQVRREWLGGSSGGRCEFGGRKWIFVDLSLSQLEQLEQLRSALIDAPELNTTPIESSLQSMLGEQRRAA